MAGPLTTIKRPIPKALYPCKYCYEDHTWLAADLYWSDIDQDWVCDPCWSDRDSAWGNDGYIDEKRGVSLAAEINRQNATKETII